MPNKGLQRAWCLYDWANSAFVTIITTFIFGVYFTRVLSSDPVAGSAQWGYAQAVAGLLIALVSPLIGVMADQQHKLGRGLAIASFFCIGWTAMLWFAAPFQSYAVPLALGCLVLATVAYEIGQIFYNAMLVHLAPADRLGRLSGLGWGLGYLGGIGSLIFCLKLLLDPKPPLWGMDAMMAEPVRATALLVAVWYGVFALPLLMLWRQPVTPAVPARRLSDHLVQMVDLARTLRTRPRMLWFLIASALYRDGLITLFAVGGVYAAVTIGMDQGKIAGFAIALNVSAGFGAWIFSRIDDRLGSRAVILLSLAALILVGGALLTVKNEAEFTILSVIMGLFIGPVQSASRTMLVRLAGPVEQAAWFGFYNLTGKSIAFLGPLCFAFATDITGQQQWGMATILIFWLVGALLMLKMPPETVSDSAAQSPQSPLPVSQDQPES